MAKPTIRPAAEYSTEEMIALLQVGAQISGTLTTRAAVHLLTYTELPGRADFAQYVEVVVENVPPPGQLFAQGEDVVAAFVTSWKALGTDPAIYRTGTDRRLLALAASLGAGVEAVPVNLREELPGLSRTAAVRVMEAVAIAAGVDEFYTVTATPKLAETLAAHDALFAGDQS